MADHCEGSNAVSTVHSSISQCSCMIVHAKCRASSSSSSAEHEVEEGEWPRISAERVERLETLIRLRKLYRNLLRADRLLAQPSPVYQTLGALPGPHHIVALPQKRWLCFGAASLASWQGAMGLRVPRHLSSGC